MEIHGDVRTDDYYWLNNRENPDVIHYLNQENAYTEAVMKDSEPFQTLLYEEMVGRIKQDDASVPYLLNGYWYYTKFHEGKEYPVFCRKRDNLEGDEIILLDVNVLSDGKSFCQIGGLSISPDNKRLAYAVDFVSRRIYTIHIKNLETGELLEQSIGNTSGGGTWANDNDTLFYTTKDANTLRSDKIHRYSITDDKSTLVYNEPDDTYNVHISKTKSKQYLVLSSYSTLTTEHQVLSADNPSGDFKMFKQRERGIEYGIAHFDNQWYILTNWEAPNFRLMECGLETTEQTHWKEKVAHRKDTLLEGIELFNDFVVLEERRNAQTHISITCISSGEQHYIAMDEDAYTCGTGTNPEFNSTTLRFGYTSLTTPSSVYDYDMVTRQKVLKKEQEVVGGYDKSAYKSERIFVKARDGAEIPVSVVYKKGTKKDGSSPLLLYAYGSYGHSMDPYFSTTRLSLLDRGFMYAIAHIRGGEEMGRKWYNDGKLLNKKNTFSDFIDCGNHLVSKKYTEPKRLYAMGGSAGGLLMGAIINMEPELWNGIVAQVPFVDVVTTMLDESIPLTTGEFDEWGNPKDEPYYNYIKSYSPYDNIEKKDYPNMLVTTGLHDSQVQYWEPAKWVAKLRDLKTDDNILLLQTEMDFGHGGASGRFERIKEVALEYVFILKLEGITG
ncbi:MAG: oligopeptidase B [Bacteroidia bacterium]|jgi:oligopeptidase B